MAPQRKRHTVLGCRGGSAPPKGKERERPHLCPRMSDWSHTPPSAILWNSRPRVLATDLPTLVLPTPGGPTKHRMGPFRLLFSCRTARYSSTLFFSFSMA